MQGRTLQPRVPADPRPNNETAYRRPEPKYRVLGFFSWFKVIINFPSTKSKKAMVIANIMGFYRMPSHTALLGRTLTPA